MADNQSTAELGRALVAEMLERRGFTVTQMKTRNLTLLLAESRSQLRAQNGGRRVAVRVKTRRSGTWQGSVSDGAANPATTHPETFWVFVDIERGKDAAEFFIAPDDWVRHDIYREHQVYLARHGGVRAESPESNHHAIQPRRVRQWRDRWDLLGV
jgi:hypothetical protein